MIVEKNITTDKTTSTFSWRGGPSFVFIQGTFNGATVTMNAGQDSLGFIALDGTAVTVESYFKVELPANAQFNFTVSGSGGSTDINVSILEPANLVT
jgi:hypothetical protein|tara:strand:- start:256 stop:546 length:291 start_codon:yes stop_codon:yes gene_type:complete